MQKFLTTMSWSFILFFIFTLPHLFLLFEFISPTIFSWGIMYPMWLMVTCAVGAGILGNVITSPKIHDMLFKK
mgnify:CR=1 FL=1